MGVRRRSANCRFTECLREGSGARKTQSAGYQATNERPSVDLSGKKALCKFALSHSRLRFQVCLEGPKISDVPTWVTCTLYRHHKQSRPFLCSRYEEFVQSL
jgi:hypothetical protein